MVLGQGLAEFHFCEEQSGSKFSTIRISKFLSNHHYDGLSKWMLIPSQESKIWSGHWGQLGCNNWDPRQANTLKSLWSLSPWSSQADFSDNTESDTFPLWKENGMNNAINKLVYQSWL